MKEEAFINKAGCFSNAIGEHIETHYRASYEDGNFGNRHNYQRGRKRPNKFENRSLKCRKPLSKPDVSLKNRNGFCYIDFHGKDVPHCFHGPCILLGRRLPSGDITDRKFVCAVYRGGECSFQCPVTDDGKIDTDFANSMAKIDMATLRTKTVYNKIWKSIKELTAAGERLYYCKSCNDAKSSAHYHELIGPLKKFIFRKPATLISFDDIDSSKAQYWFADESLKVLDDVRIANDFDGVLCIGTPSLFEFMRKNKERRQSIKSFLLDVDHRFASFYRSTQFAQYSMLANYFYDSSGENKLKKFFSSVKKLMVICDPPFGVILDPLLISLSNLRSYFKETDTDDTKQFNVVLTLPYFLEKFLRPANPPLEMADFAVCYANHRKFARSNSSAVRFFTDIPLAYFPILLKDKYRFCDMCERYVAKLNRHCGLCGVCPSKNGKTYWHCELCSRCVKPTYKHCKKCSQCHLPGRCIQ